MIRMSRIQEIIARRERVAAMYAERLARVPGERLPCVAPEVTRISWFVYVARVGVDEPTPERQSAVRDHVIRRFQEAKEGDFPGVGPPDYDLTIKILRVTPVVVLDVDKEVVDTGHDVGFDLYVDIKSPSGIPGNR